MKIIKLIDEKFEEVVSIGLLATMVVIVFFQVVMRYVFQASLSWSEELARYLFLWLIWMGAAWATKLRCHISIDALVMRLKGRAKRYVMLISTIIWFIVAVILA